MNSFRESPARKSLLRYSYIAMTVASTVTGTALLIYFVFIHASPTLGKVLNEFGYHEVVPPFEQYGPGTFNSVVQVGDQSVKLHPICKMEPGILEGLWKESPKVNKQMMAHFSHEFDVSSEFLKSLKSSMPGKRIKVAHMSLRNMRIVVLSQEDLLRIRDQYLKGGCEHAIAHKTKNGACVRQSKEVLRADLVYTFHFKEGINSMHHMSATQQETKYSMGLGGIFDTDNIISGKKLFYGVKLSPHCILKDEPTLALNES